MEAPFSLLAQEISRIYGGYSITKSVMKNISVNEAHDKLIKEGLNPWNCEKRAFDHTERNSSKRLRMRNNI